MKAAAAGATRSSAATAVTVTLALAGGLHLGVALEHGITTQHGGFFLVLGAFQVALTALVVRRPSPRLLAGSVAVSAIAVTTWAATRLPAFGQRETIGVLDLAAAGLELLTIGAGLSLLRGSLRPRPASALRTSLFLVAAGVAAMSTTAVPSSHADHHHGLNIREASAHADDDGPAAAAGAHDRPTSDQPIFGDLFADHHAAPETAGDGHPGGNESQTSADDADEDRHADTETHDHPPSDHHGTESG